MLEALGRPADAERPANDEAFLCISVDDVDDEARRLQGLGVELAAPPADHRALGGCGTVYVRDPEGNLVEFYGPLSSAPSSSLPRMIREELRRLATWSERHRRLVARILIAIGLSLVIDLVCAVLMWLFERGVHGSDIHGFGDAALFFATVQILTVSSSAKNPVTHAGRIVDVVLEGWAIFVVTAVAGAFASFFQRGRLAFSPWPTGLCRTSRKTSRTPPSGSASRPISRRASAARRSRSRAAVSATSAWRRTTPSPFGHRHGSHEEVYVVLAGSGRASSTGRSRSCGSGTRYASARGCRARLRRRLGWNGVPRHRLRRRRRHRDARRLLGRGLAAQGAAVRAKREEIHASDPMRAFGQGK